MLLKIIPRALLLVYTGAFGVGLCASVLTKRNPCDGINASPILYHDYLENDCPARFHLQKDGNCEKYQDLNNYGCITYCQLKTTFDWAQESPFFKSDCHGPSDCSISESDSTSYSFSFGVSPKVGKALKLGISGGYSQSYATSHGRSWSFHPEKGVCGYFTFVPVRKTTCGTLSESIQMWQDGMWMCAPTVNTTKNFCVPEPWRVDNKPDGAVIFVYTDCLTRQPLGPEHQDPIYNMPGVPLDRGTLSAMQQTWVANTCEVEHLQVDGGLTSGFLIRGHGFADQLLGENGEKLKQKLENCGDLVTWSFNWVTKQQYDWQVEGVIKAQNAKACCGDAILSVGGVTRDKCV